MSRAAIEFYQEESNEGEEGRWRWRLKAANGEIVASGEGYTTRADAERGVRAVCRAALELVMESLL